MLLIRIITGTVPIRLVVNLDLLKANRVERSFGWNIIGAHDLGWGDYLIGAIWRHALITETARDHDAVEPVGRGGPFRCVVDGFVRPENFVTNFIPNNHQLLGAPRTGIQVNRNDWALEFVTIVNKRIVSGIRIKGVAGVQVGVIQSAGYFLTNH